MTLAGHTFTNPSPQQSGGGGGCVPIFVKYNSQGQVVWANQHFPISNGLPYSPDLIYTDRQGYTYAYYGGFQDSFTIQGYTLRDTSIHQGITIAKYDPSGNIEWIRAKKSRGFYQSYTAIIDMLPWDDTHMLLLAEVNNGGVNPYQTDTIDGIPLPQGSFLIIMDTATKFEKIKYLGCDTITWPLAAGGYALYHNPISSLSASGMCTNIKKSVYFELSPETKTVWDTSIHITDAFSYITAGSSHNLFMKFDSSFDFQWSIGGRGASYGFASDINDNLYIGLQGTNISFPYDSIDIGNLSVQIKFYNPSPGYYDGVAKISGNGTGLWIDTFFNLTGGASGNPQAAIFTDRLGNVYLGGTYNLSLNAAPYSLTESGNLFVMKLDDNGNVKWMQSTNNAAGRIGAFCNFGADDKGDVYINGIYFYTGQPGFGLGDPIFGRDSLRGITPIAGFPVAPDIFNARLGNCNTAIPSLTASGPLHWCGRDSVTLTAQAANTYLWSSGDTTQSIVVNASGSYSVYDVDTLGCYAQSAFQLVKANSDPTLTIDSLYDGATVIVSCAVMPYSYIWSNASTRDSITGLIKGWYTVTVTDANGCRAIDSIFITGPNGIIPASDDRLSVYPNPCSGSFYISTTMEASMAAYSIDGRKVASQPLTCGLNKIDVRTWATGIYQISIRIDGHEQVMKMVIRD